MQTLAGLPIPRGLHGPGPSSPYGDSDRLGAGTDADIDAGAAKVPAPQLPRPAPPAQSRRAEQHSRLQRRLDQMQMKRPVPGHHTFQPPGSTIWWTPSPQDPETHPCRLAVELLLRTECDVK